MFIVKLTHFRNNTIFVSFSSTFRQIVMRSVSQFLIVHVKTNGDKIQLSLQQGSWIFLKACPQISWRLSHWAILRHLLHCAILSASVWYNQRQYIYYTKSPFFALFQCYQICKYNVNVVCQTGQACCKIDRMQSLFRAS